MALEQPQAPENIPEPSKPDLFPSSSSRVTFQDHPSFCLAFFLGICPLCLLESLLNVSSPHSTVKMFNSLCRASDRICVITENHPCDISQGHVEDRLGG